MKNFRTELEEKSIEELPEILAKIPQEKVRKLIQKINAESFVQ